MYSYVLKKSHFHTKQPKIVILTYNQITVWLFLN